MEINEQTNIQPEQSNQFMPRTKFNIPKSTIQKVKSTITALNSGLVGKDNFAASASTPYTFVINPNNQTVIDLSQCYFNVAGTLKIPEGENMKSTDIKFGNLFLSSLFQQFSLSIGGTVVALNANPGIDANIQAALKFDQYDLINKTVSIRQFLMNSINQGFKPGKDNISFVQAYWKFPAIAQTATNTTAEATTVETHEAYKGQSFVWSGTAFNIPFAASGTPGTQKGIINGVDKINIWFDDDGNGHMLFHFASIATSGVGTGDVNQAAINLVGVSVYGSNDMFVNEYTDIIPMCNDITAGTTIPFRCKFYLSDMFNYTVDSLDYIFNREINITLQRGSTNFIIANPIIGNSRELKIEVNNLSKFELICFSYLLTDTAKQQLLAYYSRPVETLFGVQTTNLTPLYQATGGTEQNITLPLTVNYDTKCILLAFPKCSNALQPLSTPKSWMTVNKIETDANRKYQASWYASNSNSYNFGGLKYIRISNTSNSNIYTYDFQGTEESVINPLPLQKSYDWSNANNDTASKILDYREAYDQFKQIRLLFGKDPDNGISYSNYLKDYCVIPIDLTGSNIPPNTRIFITFQFASFEGSEGALGYNPLFYGNIGNSKQLTTNLLAVFLGSDVLQYNPDGTCIVKHILTAGTNEKAVNIK